MNNVVFIDPITWKSVTEKKNPITVNFKYFSNTTGMSYYDGILHYPRYHKANKGLKGTIKSISPDQYLGESARNRFVPVSLPDELRGIYSPAVEQYAVRARQGEKMPIPVIDRVNHEQEGRHRAMVAKKLGLKKIPVLFIERA